MSTIMRCISMIFLIVPCASLGVRLPLDFAIIGAGGAGITVIGVLDSLGIPLKRIAWIDPEFNVGRLGQYYQNVPANAKTQMFIDFIEACPVFLRANSPAIAKLFSLDRDKEYPLQTIVEPLQDITNYLRTKVRSYKSFMRALDFDVHNDVWVITLSDGQTITARSVVLATGSHPRVLNYEECKNQIPLDEALDQTRLATHVDAGDTIAVVGSAHSAILILMYLSRLPVARVINFFSKPIVYPIQMDGWVLHDNTGLMGLTARWAQDILEKNPPAKILRLSSKEEMIRTWLPICTKVIYAVGFERNELPQIPGVSYDSYDPHTGTLGKRIFVIGIAFPEEVTDPLGNVEKAVGLPDFMDYALREVPSWILKDIGVPGYREVLMHNLKRFDELFSIYLV